MSYKTDRLTSLFPEAYAASERESLLYKLLDAIGAELMGADDAIKRLLKSHWVTYASGPALDGLAASYGVSRRRLRDGSLEPDREFRQRLTSVVRLFTGGGTVRAVTGAVRSALGLPFDLDQLNLPPDYRELRQAIENLVRVEEFSPRGAHVVFEHVAEVDEASELMLVVEDIETVREAAPRIEWTFTSGGARLLSLERLDTGAGVKTTGGLVVPEGTTLVLSTRDGGQLSAAIGLDDVTRHFTNLDDTQPARLPEVPTDRSEWKFRARGGFGVSRFDAGEGFDLPRFRVEMLWMTYEPLTFDVYVPYFLKRAVEQLVDRYGYTGELFVFEGLPLERIQEVVDQTRAAGVRGSVHFSLPLFDRHDHYEGRLARLGEHRAREDAHAEEALTAGSLETAVERHEVRETLVIGGVFDVSPFDRNHGFL